jgi:putative NADH-flavin reductase
MVDQGVLRECLLDLDVESVLAIVRKTSLPQHAKLREIVHQDVPDLSSIEARLAGFDACFFCLGVSAVGMKEEECMGAYEHSDMDRGGSKSEIQRTLG